MTSITGVIGARQAYVLVTMADAIMGVEGGVLSLLAFWIPGSSLSRWYSGFLFFLSSFFFLLIPRASRTVVDYLS